VDYLIRQNEPVNILLVDDDPALLEVAEAILKETDNNLCIESTQTVDNALTKLATKTFDIIISDYEMPEKDGLTFLKALREKNIKIPFILFTGKGREEIAIQALNLGADRYINKHGNPETVYKELTISIHQLYDKSRSKDLLVESQERLRLFIENAPDAIFMCDLQGRLLDQNQQAEKLHGYNKKELFGKTVFEVGMLKVEEAPSAQVHAKEIEAGLGVGPNEYTLKRKDGSKVIVEVSIFPVKRDKNIELLGIARDITERKNAERELEQKHQALERVAESLDSGLTIIGRDYRVIWANSVLQKMGLEGTKHCYEIFGNQKSVCPDCGVKKIFEKNISLDIHEFKTTATSGNNTWVELRVTPLKDNTGKVIAALELAVPIGHRKQAEAALRESEERYAKLSAASFEGILISRKGRILDANLQFLNLHGYSLEEIVGKEAPDILVAPRSRELVRKNMRTDFEHPYEFVGLRKDGTTFSIEVRAKSITYKGAPARVSAVRDITQRKKAEEQLLIFSNLFELVGDAIYVSDLSGRIVYFNEAAHKQAGYSRDEMAKLTLYEFCSPAAAKLVPQRIKRIVEKKSVVFESEHMRKDGSIIPCEVFARVIESNETKLILNAARDLSERNKTQKTLLESEERYRMIAENMTDVVTLMDENGVFTYVSPSAKTVYGYNPEELIGTRGADFTHPDDMENIVRPAIALLKQTGVSPLIELRVRKKDGSYVWIERGSKVFIDKNNRPQILAIARAIEGRKRVEKELKLTSTIFELANDAIYVYDLDGRLVFSNKAAYRKLGYTKDEITNISLRQLDANGGEFVNGVIKEVEKKGAIVFETQHVKKDGSKVPVEIHTTHVTADGKRLALSVVRDITERKKAEARLAQVNEKLRVVGSLTRHDVRNKLSTINSTAYLLKKKYPNDPEMAKYVANLESAVAMANRLFDFTEFYEKIGALEQTEVNIKGCFDEAVALYPNLGNLKVVNETEGLVVVADSLLRQVFYNLIDNSLKHGREVSQIRLYFYNEEDNQTKLVYEDNGQGVPFQNKPNIFTEHFTTGNGTGLGLSMIRKMMEVYSWTIQENGVPGEGARFEITIPSKSRVS
jgi:PAS domain S-box-containing protein